MVDCSLAQLDGASLLGPLCINDVVYAEISVRYDRIEDLDAMLAETGIEIMPIPRAALFLAAKVFTNIASRAGHTAVSCPIFSLVLMRPLAACPC